MGEFIPRINLPLEGVAHAKWLEDRSIKDRADIDALLAWQAKMGRDSATNARQVTAVNVYAHSLEQRTNGSRGVPEPSNPGETLRTDRSGELKWMPNLAGTTPRLSIVLEEGAPTYQWDIFAIDGEAALPIVQFYDDGRSFEVVGWRDVVDPTGDYWGLIPINFDILVIPHADGDTFGISLPSDSYYIGSGETSNFTVAVENVDATYTADVVFGSSDLLFGGGTQRYKDSRLVPWRVDTDPGSFENRATLAPFDRLGWFVEQSSRLENHLTPALYETTDDDDRLVSFPLDYYYWRFVGSRKRAERVHVPGTVTVAALKEVLYNDTPDSLRVGLVRATVGTAPTGAALEVDVKVDGVVVATVSIAAGDTTATAEPTGFTHGPTGTHTTAESIGGDAVIWFPGDALSFEVTQVGSTVAGADLTVQVWAG